MRTTVLGHAAVHRTLSAVVALLCVLGLTAQRSLAADGPFFSVHDITSHCATCV